MDSIQAPPIVMEYCTVERLIPYARNPRRNDDAVDRMVASIKEYGFRIPILARHDGEVVDGHLRLKAARKLELTSVPVVWCDEWTPSQVKAFRLLVNRSASWADWDEELLRQEFLDLKELEIDLAVTGFDAKEIDDLLFRSQVIDEDQAPAPLDGAAVTKPGDLWVCGSDRLLCGDATSAADVKQLLDSVVPGVMIIDPPYGVSYDPQWRERAGLGATRQRGLVNHDDCFDWTEAYRLFPGDVVYVWHAGLHAGEVAQGLHSAGFELRAQIVWVKQHFALSRGHYHWAHEPCWYAVRRGSTARWCGDRGQSTVWEIPNLNPFGGGDEEVTGHGTQKPVELIKRPILNHTVRGDAVFDPFLGSGTTLMAADATERICYGIEIDPVYVDLAVRRWQARTGQKVVRAQDGKPFEAKPEPQRDSEA
jgi:DNA modification methylase